MKIRFLLRFHTEIGQSLHLSMESLSPAIASIGKNLDLTYFDHDHWQGFLEFEEPVEFAYRYVLENSDGVSIPEGGEPRKIAIDPRRHEILELVDTWCHAGEFENVFYSDPFQQVLLKENETRIRLRESKHFNYQFKIKAPLLNKNEVVCLLGTGPFLNDWETETPIVLQKENGWWTCRLVLGHENFPLTYKYGVYNVKEKKFIGHESGADRILHGDAQEKKLSVIHDGFIHLPNSSWKGAGVSVPVFSLRSKDSFGIGEFPDLKLLVDWARKTGLKLIQILPVNDTTATHSWTDSYPYASISAFALHPVYLNLDQVAGKKCSAIVRPMRKKQKQLNELDVIDYEQVLKFKLSTLRELYLAQKEEFLKDEDYLEFFNNNRFWLVPYAAFCYLRDRNGTADFTRWKLYSTYNKDSIQKYVSPRAKHYDEIAFHYFVQYHLHTQLKNAAEYAHKHGVILKGDIPIGIYRYSVDAWMEPELYHMDHQAGAPPDGFAPKGQNWGFPTYNWEKMAENGFEWWHRRFVQMSNYFDAFRIDHILGFFRIWSIPVDSNDGSMGFFVPALPVHIHEFSQRGMWFNYHRLCRPYINDGILWEWFGPNNDKFKVFLNAVGNGHYELKEEFDTQRKVEIYFSELEANEENYHLKQGLFDLIANVILFEHPGSNGQQFHFRIQMDQTASFRYLDWHMQNQLRDLYVDYFYRRQDEFWRKEAMKKLPALKNSTNMLICGEDLGMVPHCVPDVMKQLGILSLEIQRMPKDPNKEFFHPATAPYLSVVTPSTHDMSTIRGWWEESADSTQRFFNHELGQQGEAPETCEAWINRAIVLQHLYSPAIWSIFQLQDLFGMDEELRRPSHNDERINVPANSKHYWQYRMHMTLEELLKEKSFNDMLEEYVSASGRG